MPVSANASLMVQGTPCSGGSSPPLLHERVGGVRLGARQLVAIADDGVDDRVHTLDALDVRFDRIARGQRAFADQSGELDSGKQAGVVHEKPPETRLSEGDAQLRALSHNVGARRFQRAGAAGRLGER